jgi:formate C-acetyltransferase
VPKYGRDEGEIRDFATQVFADAARVASGQPNSRGGRYVASLFAHMSSIRYGQQGGATPDGRKAGEPLSKSMGPSTTALGSRHDLGSVLDALEPLDLTDYPVVAVLDVKLPLVPPRQARQVIKPIIQRFLQIGGSVLQVNTLDAETLRDARRDPDNHRDVVVRVSGFSAYFTTLPGNQQDEIIQRTQFA